ncbi:hypothetical protein ACTJJ7_14285 [Phyllobacterium sp. 22229]|jgi:hypothetical protein|uniref:hypothetical protein n=1 Tax=Phyllobacterium TaxID=28100 RepID=UPI0010D97546|nr:hypothetical protein [Phyllobacterium myrsinacearum]RZS83839.1 hypothetical protein EV217_2588 [Phyllobacterium myrsinacearum]
MTIKTVPQEVYQRHEREWQVLREALAKNKSASDSQPIAAPSLPADLVPGAFPQ